MKTLFNYQKPALKKVLLDLSTCARALLVLATGLGKTIVSAFVAKHYISQGKRVLFLYCENEGLSQAEKTYREILGNKIQYRRFYGSSNQRDWDADKADVLFASFQSMNQGENKWFLIFNKNHFDLVIVDEAHHGQAVTYKEVIDYFNAHKLGLTATPDREDDKDIRDIFGEPSYEISLAKGIANGWLAPIKYHVLSDGINTRKLKKICRDVLNNKKRITIKQLNETIFVQKRDDVIAGIIKKRAGKRKSMIFCENINHAEFFSQSFKDNEIAVVHSKKTSEYNRIALEKFRKREIQYISSVNKFNEAIDVPDVELTALLRATDSKTVFFQQIGRGARLIKGKKNLIVLDFVQNIERLIMLREFEEEVREEAEKLDLKELDRDLLDVTGNGHIFDFSDTHITEILKVVDAIREGFYETLSEAREACLRLGITDSATYKSLYMKDLRLPSKPYEYYSNNWISWMDFFNKNLAPKGWLTASSLGNSIVTQGGRDKIIDIAEKYRKNHPEWFMFYYVNSVSSTTEHYHPDLVTILKGLCAKKEKAPKGWMTASKIYDSYKIQGAVRRIKKFALKYKEDYPEWFMMYMSGKTRYTEHYHPNLVRIIKKNLVAISKPSNKWKTPSQIFDMPDVFESLAFIKKSADSYRISNPEWFASYKAGDSYRTVEHYHLDLIKKLKENFQKIEKAPDGWITPHQLSDLPKILGSEVQMKKRAENYRKKHPEWFAVYLAGNKKVEHYHPDLVTILKGLCAKKEKAPKGWMTAVGINKLPGIKGGLLAIHSIVGNYRKSNPSWFEIYFLNTRNSEHYHPDLVKIIKQKLKKS